MFNFFKSFFNFFRSKSDSHTLYVGNLIYSATNHDLQEIFSPFGDIESTRIIKDNRTRRSKGYGFVTYKNSKSAQEALSMEGNAIKGRPLRVRLANAKTYSN